VAAAGSNNPLFWEAAAICLAPWMVMTCLLSVMLFRGKNQVYTSQIMIGCGLILLVQFVYGFVFNGHRIWTTLIEQNQELSVPNLAGLKVSAEMAQEVAQVRDRLVLGGFQDGDPILAFYDRPGLVYAVGGRSLGIPWFFRLSPRQNLFTIDENLPTAPKRYFLVLEDREMKPDMASAFAKAGAAYPQSFKYLGYVHKSGQKIYGQDLFIFAHGTEAR
jgi:hypothetical protein